MLPIRLDNNSLVCHCMFIRNHTAQPAAMMHFVDVSHMHSEGNFKFEIKRRLLKMLIKSKKQGWAKKCCCDVSVKCKILT